MLLLSRSYIQQFSVPLCIVGKRAVRSIISRMKSYLPTSASVPSRINTIPLYDVIPEPMTEYVISVRAYNRIGEGQSLQDTVRTLPEAQVAPPASLVPPVGLKGTDIFIYKLIGLQ